MKALSGVDNGGALKIRCGQKQKRCPPIDKINYSAVYAKIGKDI